ADEAPQELTADEKHSEARVRLSRILEDLDVVENGIRVDADRVRCDVLRKDDLEVVSARPRRAEQLQDGRRAARGSGQECAALARADDLDRTRRDVVAEAAHRRRVSRRSKEDAVGVVRQSSPVEGRLEVADGGAATARV